MAGGPLAGQSRIQAPCGAQAKIFLMWGSCGYVDVGRLSEERTGLSCVDSNTCHLYLQLYMSAFYIASCEAFCPCGSTVLHLTQVQDAAEQIKQFWGVIKK
jgi:hypothetical protein